MAGQNAPFQPAGTLTLAASTTAATGTLPTGGDACLVYNASTAIAFVRLDGNAPTSADTPVPPTARLLLNCPSTVTQASATLLSGTGAVYFIRGTGSVY